MTTEAVAQQRIEELCAAAIRALAGCADVHFRGRRLYQGRSPVPLHAPHQKIDDDAPFADRRAIADGVALRLRDSDAAVHRALAPADPVERLVFEMLEQFRVESLADAALPGVRGNLERRFSRWADEFAGSGLVDTDIGLMMFAVALISRARIHGVQVLERYEDLLEPTRAGLAPLLGADFAGIRAHRLDQRAFAGHALSIARIVAASVHGEEVRRGRPPPRDDNRREVFALDLEFDDEEGERFATVADGDSRVLDESDDGYRVFTRAYDRELPAGELARPAHLAALRRALDERVRRHGINVSRLARLFKAMLARPERDGFSFGEESGYVDGRRLSQLVASPAERRLFRRERFEPHARCRFTILVDCSGSMKQYMDSLSCLVDIMVRAMERAEILTEVLGFTTGAWNGGRARRDWLRQGRPRHPGRLAETCHIVFKDADTSWRRARASIAALDHAEIFREGVDGEAVAWACRRLAAADAERRILMVVSDGSPMETSTALANDAFYLDNHLRQVVERVGASRQVEIMGLGVGLDLSPYYDMSLAVDLSEGLSSRLFFDILEVLRGHHRR